VVVGKSGLSMVEDPIFYAHSRNKAFLVVTGFFVITATIHMACMDIVHIKQNQQANG
jgi:hypothetical protein